MNKRGVALILGFMVIVVLFILGGAIISRSVSERFITQRYVESTQAFWLAEAGVNRAWNGLRSEFNVSVNLTNPEWSGTLSTGQYEVFVVENIDSENTKIASHGYVPTKTGARAERVLEAVMNQYQNIPPAFYDNAIYSAGDVSIGSNCIVNGNVFSGGTVTGPVNGVTTPNDPTLHNNGLPALSFAELRQKSIDQGWYNPVTNTTTYPTIFWNVAPSPANPAGIPNVVFVNGDFTLVGGQQVVKGFIVVGGDTVYDAEIGGNASIDGCIYTQGNIWLHGGGGNIINVDGGVWAGGTVTITGNEQINFNPDGPGYMDAIRDGLHPNTDVQIIDWRDAQNPYTLTP